MTATTTNLDPVAAQAAIEYCYNQDWSDGLPLVPATQDLVDQFLATTVLDHDQVIGNLEQLSRSITVETAAINAAMAGCRPEYFPVVLAAWEALMAERAVRGGGWQSTSGPAPLIMVNGPVRHELGFNTSGGIFGPGFRANATVARAIGLMVRNGYGIKPHVLEQATQGIPGRWSICFGEDEENNPWEPLVVETGLARETNAVTATLIRTSEFVDNRHSKDVTHVLQDFADTISRTGSWMFRHSPCGIIMNPEHARMFSEAGMSKQDVREWLVEHSGKTGRRLAASGKDVVGEGGARTASGTDGDDQFHHIMEDANPENLLIAVAGSRNAAMSMVVRVFGRWSATSIPVADVATDTTQPKDRTTA